ncbi:beta-N-acetylhexosaminidase [Oceanobacter kriegii]|uniref:beta-N-acetylhexosaminidase n=1 Tax=Oceanobacter kriegii TaxID=64972 RepID=UPI00040AD3EE|nr:beta-N-acetylhexosaminidase [Oceanobacter kriegii]
MSFDLISSESRLSVGVIADLIGTELVPQDRVVLDSPALSGLILFARNYQSRSQLTQLLDAVRRERPELPVFVDQEGGRVQRFRDGFIRLPAMMRLGECFAADTEQAGPEQAVEAAEKLGFVMAAELGLMGVDTSFAPVLDIERGCSRVIGDRAFGTSAVVVAQLASAFIQGMRAAGMKAVGKHFPGHGAVEADSHKELPLDDRSYAQLMYDMRPFKQLSASGLLDGVMPAHVVYPAVDPVSTAGFSQRWMQLLRQRVGFDGVVFSDDLTMEGAAKYGDYRKRAELAMAAGCNALVVCNVPEGAEAVLQAVVDATASADSPYRKLDLSDWRIRYTGEQRQQIEADLQQHIQWLVKAGLIQHDFE